MHSEFRKHNFLLSLSFSYSTIFVCLLFLVSCAQVPGATKVSTPTRATITPVLFQNIHMFNASTGWSFTYDPSNHNHILHTTAGVTHWQDVTPAPGSQRAVIDTTDFMDPMTAWVATETINSSLFLYHTHDGGKSWQKAQLPGQEHDPIQIFFLNSQVGWIMFLNGAATGNMLVDLLHTTNGGATWKLIPGCQFNKANNPTEIPCTGDKGGLSFLNENVGWITGFTNANLVWLYKTTDGGMTWHHQPLPVSIASAYQISTMPPVFFNTTNGLLPVIIPNTAGQTTIIYVTHDGGATWHATTPILTSVSALDFVDAMHGWIVTNTFDAKTNLYNSTTIYQTNDEGKNWTQQAAKLDADIASIDFVSSSQGWAIDALHLLYQTTDSGQTWTKVTPTLAVHSQR